jgi:hypothetical protein
VAEYRRRDGVNRVLLLTDGQANRGITQAEALEGLCRISAEQGITTTTIGFGPHFDEDLLRAMADAGRGSAYYVEHADQASGVFEEELEGLLSLVAQNVRVHVRPGRGAGAMKVLHEYPSHSEGRELTLDVGDLYAREPRRVLLEILLEPDATEDGEAHVADLEVVAQVLTAGGGVEQQTLTLPIRLSPEAGGRVEPEVRKEVLLLEAARAREEALEAERRGDYRGGSETLQAGRPGARQLSVSRRRGERGAARPRGDGGALRNRRGRRGGRQVHEAASVGGAAEPASGEGADPADGGVRVGFSTTGSRQPPALPRVRTHGCSP